MRNFFLNNVLVYKALLIKGKGCKKGAYGLIYSGGVVAQMGDKVQRWGVQKYDDTMLIKINDWNREV